MGGGNSLYTHYVTVYRVSNYITVAVEYKTSRATPFASAQDFADELKEKGFTVANNGYLPASGSGGNGVVYAISLNDSNENNWYFAIPDSQRGILISEAKFCDIIAT